MRPSTSVGTSNLGYPTPASLSTDAAKIEGTVRMDRTLWAVLAGQLYEAARPEYWDDTAPGTVSADDMAEAWVEFTVQLLALERE